MKRLVLLFCTISLFYSCRTLNPSVMFQTEDGYQYAQPDSATKRAQSEYRLAEFDELELLIYTNSGYKLVDVTGSSSSASTNMVHYNIEKDGFVKLPQLGRVLMKGYTVREAEKFLEEKYSSYFNNPFIIIHVASRKVYLFTGDGGKAAVLSMTSDNVTLVEALAMAGGMSERGKAYKIKIIRGDLKNPQIFLIDLSTVEGMKEADLQLQSNDIIYIEPTRNFANSVLVQLTPIMGLVTTIILVIALINSN